MSTGTKLGSGFALVMAIIVAITVHIQVNLQYLSQANREVVLTHRVLEGLERLVSLLKDAETGQRGFLLTGEKKYLEPYTASSGRIPREFEGLSSLTGNNPEQQERLRRVRELADAKLAKLDETIRLWTNSSPQAALQVVRTDRGKQIMDDLRAMVDEMETCEQVLLEARSHSAEAISSRTLLIAAFVMPLALVAIAAAMVALMRNIRYLGPAPRPATPRRKWPETAVTYISAAALVGVAAVLRWLGESWGPLPLFITFYPAVLLAAVLGGSGPGILATVLSGLVADYFFVPPVGHFVIANPSDVLALGIFVSTNLSVSILADRLQRSRWIEAVSTAQEQELALLDMGNLLALDRDHRIVRWSKGCHRLYGFDPQEAQGRLVDELLQTRDPEFLEGMNRTLLEQGFWEGQLTRRRKNGTDIVVEILWALRRDVKGRPVAILEVSTDLTQQMRDAMEIQRQARKLSQKNEKLSAQAGELARQNEGIRLQSEEIQSLNAQLAHRGELLQRLLDSTRLGSGEQSVLREICSAAIAMIGESACAAVVYEEQGGRLAVRAKVGLEPNDSELELSDAEHSFVEQVILEDRTTGLVDELPRAHCPSLCAPGQQPFQAILASPMRINGKAVGAVAIHSRRESEWTEAQFRVAEWLATRCSQILETLRLRAHLSRQAALIDLSPDAIIVRRLDGTVTFWSRGAEALYHWDKDQAIGQPIHILLQTRFPEPQEQVVERLKREGRWSGELTHRTSDGREVVVQSRWLARLDARGEVEEFLESNVDMTERNRNEARIFRQAAILEGINRIFRKTLSSRTEEDLGRTCLAVAEDVTASKFGFLGEINPTTGLLNEIAISGPGWEECRLDAAGERRPTLHLMIHRIYGRVLTAGRGLFTNDSPTHPDRVGVPSGHPPLTAILGVPLVRGEATIGMVAVGNREGGYGPEELESLEALAPTMVEAFSRNRAEAALHRLNRELDERVRARTIELEAANKELEAFSYSVSHDLRAPLRSMDGFSVALLETYDAQLDVRGRDWLNRIRSASQRMGQLIDDILGLSRLTRVEMRHRSVDLGAMAREIAGELQETAPERLADFRIAEELTCTGDPDLLKPALRNLLENAWKFTARCPTALIEMGRVTTPLASGPIAGPDSARPPAGETTYFVRDNGAGFDMAYADKLFAPFQRLHAAKDYPGTGIGLALVKCVVHRHGGRIWAEAVPDQGATFYFTLNEPRGGHGAQDDPARGR